ncbi:hypothetical protein, partial [Snodgrassella communis]|uniref:hypothetical protein n=1 Tax=Snodgrassella communis TaxID=2946699 RepID=UPI001ED9A4CB
MVLHHLSQSSNVSHTEYPTGKKTLKNGLLQPFLIPQMPLNSPKKAVINQIPIFFCGTVLFIYHSKYSYFGLEYSTIPSHIFSPHSPIAFTSALCRLAQSLYFPTTPTAHGK